MVCTKKENELSHEQWQSELRQGPQDEEPAENVHIQLKDAKLAKDDEACSKTVNFVDAVLDKWSTEDVPKNCPTVTDHREEIDAKQYESMADIQA